MRRSRVQEEVPYKGYLPSACPQKPGPKGVLRVSLECEEVFQALLGQVLHSLL